MPAESKEKEREVRAFEPEERLVGWSAPARPFKRRSREYYVSIFAVAGLFGLIFLLIEGIMPVVLIAAIVFLFYVLSTVEPEKIQYSITNKGIKIHDRLTEWDLIIRFWFVKRQGNELLIIDTFRVPGRLEIVIDPEKKDEVRKFLGRHVLEEKAQLSYSDRAVDWVSKKLPE